MHSLQLAAFHGQVARFRSTAAQHNSVIFSRQGFSRHIFTDFHAGDKTDAFGRHEVHPAFDHGFIQLHIGDAVHQQPTDAVSTFVDGDGMPGAVEQISRSQTGRAGTHDSHFFAGADRRRFGCHPPFGEGFFNDRQLVVLDGHRWI